MKDYMFMAMTLLRKRKVAVMVKLSQIDKLTNYLSKNNTDGKELSNEKILEIIGETK